MDPELSTEQGDVRVIREALSGFPKEAQARGFGRYVTAGPPGAGQEALAALDRLAAALERAERERDEERERFHRHVETMIEPQLLARAEKAELALGELLDLTFPGDLPDSPIFNERTKAVLANVRSALPPP